MSEPSSDTARTARLLTEIAVLHRDGVLSDAEYEAAVARVSVMPADAPTREGHPEETLEDEGQTPKRSGIKLVWIGGAIAAVVVVAVFALARENENEQSMPNRISSSTTTSATPTVSVNPEIPVIQDSLRLFNMAGNTPARLTIESYMQFGASNRCWVGFAVDFPDQVLLTVIWPFGGWVQVTIDPDLGPDPYSMRSGADYTAAGINATQFDVSNYPCETQRDGTIELLVE